jgi:hypothetical protein
MCFCATADLIALGTRVAAPTTAPRGL